MSSAEPSNTNDNQLCVHKKEIIPVMLTNDIYGRMRERFHEEMKRIDQQMQRFSEDIMRFYGKNTMIQSALGVPKRDDQLNWDTFISSPLVEGEGDDKILKLQFDVSQFDPTEVTVRLLNDVLVVSAAHEEKTNEASVYREYNREFRLPPGTDPELVVSSLSKDGVLTVTAPLPQPRENIALSKE